MEVLTHLIENLVKEWSEWSRTKGEFEGDDHEEERGTGNKIEDKKEEMEFPVRMFHIFYPTDGVNDDVNPIRKTVYHDLQAWITKLQA